MEKANIFYPQKMGVAKGVMGIYFRDAPMEAMTTEGKIIGTAMILETLYKSIAEAVYKKMDTPKNKFASKIMENITVLDNQSTRQSEKSIEITKMLLSSELSIENHGEEKASIGATGDADQIAACMAFMIKAVEHTEYLETNTEGKHMDELTIQISLDSERN